MLLNGEHPDTQKQIIPSWIFQDAIKPQVSIVPQPEDPEITKAFYGLAQMTSTYRVHKIIYHPGGMPGQRSAIIRLPDEMVGVAIMCNDDDLGDMFNEVAKWRIIDDLLGLDPVDFKTR
jgi:hypothetical protein